MGPEASELVYTDCTKKGDGYRLKVNFNYISNEKEHADINYGYIIFEFNSMNKIILKTTYEFTGVTEYAVADAKHNIGDVEKSIQIIETTYDYNNPTFEVEKDVKDAVVTPEE